MMSTFVFIMAIFGICIADHHDKINPKQLPLNPENRFASGVYDFNFLNPQQPSAAIPTFNFADPRDLGQSYPPQLYYYGGRSDQPFLVHPGVPPNHFPFPQPGVAQGPRVIFGNGQQPGNPVFLPGGSVGNFPNQKPAFMPPIEKDAEEIPTNPSKVPPFKPKKPVRKPEKIETFDETPENSEADDLRKTAKTLPRLPVTPKAGPPNTDSDHRYFVLNGHPIFNYPMYHHPQEADPKNHHKFAQTHPQEVPVPVIPAPYNPNFPSPTGHNGFKHGFPLHFDPYHGNHVRFQHVPPYHPSQFPVNNIQSYTPHLPLTKNLGSGAFKTDLSPAHTQEEQNIRIKVSNEDFNLQKYYEQQEPGAENDAVVIDASPDEKAESEAVVVPAKEQREPSLAQAGPGAIALAGPGGVAAAGPKATAFAGKEGMAISNPRATAIAGPSEEDTADGGEGNKDKKSKDKLYLSQRYRYSKRNSGE